MAQTLAYYLRLSDKDIDLKRNVLMDESNSIAAQRSLILRHIEQEPELRDMTRMEFCDDGYSGTNFERPSFQKMIALAKQGRIACIVVKDLSRFGRDYLEVGDYLEHVFPFLGIRILSINDRYDSLSHDGKTSGMDVAFRNLIYDYYSKDLSTKVKTAMRIRQERGEYISSVPFGYRRSETNKHRMEIDPPAAKIVRDVFELILSGKSTSEAAAELNDRGVPTPQAYKGVKRREDTAPQWTRSRINDMIRNIKYAGMMPTHTRESRYIRDKNQRRVPRDEWIIHEGMHEAIIPMEMWEAANKKLGTRAYKGRALSGQDDRVFYCAHCGRKLQKSNGRDTYYYCASSSAHTGSICDRVRLWKAQVEETIAAALRVQLCFVEQAEEPVRKKTSDSLDCYHELQRVAGELAQLSTKKLEQYEAYKDGRITREEFLAIKDEIAAQTDRLNEKKSLLEERYQSYLTSQQAQDEKENDTKQANRILHDYDSGLKEHLYEAVKRVIVTDRSHIEIEWVFPDLFAQTVQN